MKTFNGVGSFVFFGLLILGITTQAYAKWPDRPITIVITSEAGGGNDIVTRALASNMEKYLKATINCINQAGLTGGLGMDMVAGKPSDGNWWLATPQFGKPLRVMGYTKLSPWKDWQYFKSCGGPVSWSVKADSPFKTIRDFLETSRKNPGKQRVAMGGFGNFVHEANVLLAKEAKIEFNQVPYKSDAPANLASLGGEVEVVISTLGSQVELIKAGKLRSLAVFSKDPLEIKGTASLIPITDSVPGMVKYTPFGSAYTFALKRDTPVEILQKVKEAFLAAIKIPDFSALLERRFFFKEVAVGEEADRLAARDESLTAWLLWDLKAEGVKVNPADLGIPKPDNFGTWWPPKDYRPLISSK